MKKIGFFILFFLSFSAQSQDVGALIHYQKKCQSCLMIASEKFDSKKFTIYVPDSIYSGGNITIKIIDQAKFKVRKAKFEFDNKEITRAQFYVKGKNNIAAFDEWLALKIATQPQLGDNIFLVMDNNRTIIYADNRRKNKIAVVMRTQ
jgi:hypothetical protein